MKNKHFLYSLSLTLSLFVVTILSLFIKSDVFENIAKVITIPLLFFTSASFAYSIAEDIIVKCKSRIEVEQERYNTYDYQKFVLENDLKMVSRYENPSTKDEEELNQAIDEREQQLATAKSNIKDILQKTEVFGRIVSSLENNKILKIVYCCSLSLLLVSIMISPLLNNLVANLSTTFLTLLSLFITMFEIILKDSLTGKILDILILKNHSEVTKNER